MYPFVILCLVNWKTYMIKALTNGVFQLLGPLSSQELRLLDHEFPHAEGHLPVGILRARAG